MENTIQPIGETLPWFKRWFESAHYHQLYANRSEQEAADFIDTLVITLQPKSQATMLDIGCGAGRHCRQLSAKGYDVTGIDIAFSSIREAKKTATDTLRFYQHDMRVPFGNNHFDYVFNFFTSFGYFTTESEHQCVVRNMSNALKPGGKLVLDYLNVPYAEERLVPTEQKETDGVVYHITRWMDDTRFFKKIEMEGAPGEQFEYTEEVAKFRLPDFWQLFVQHGLWIEEIYGDYELNEYDSKSSPRLIMVAVKG